MPSKWQKKKKKNQSWFGFLNLIFSESFMLTLIFKQKLVAAFFFFTKKPYLGTNTIPSESECSKTHALFNKIENYEVLLSRKCKCTGGTYHNLCTSLFFNDSKFRLPVFKFHRIWRYELKPTAKCYFTVNSLVNSIKDNRKMAGYLVNIYLYWSYPKVQAYKRTP